MLAIGIVIGLALHGILPMSPLHEALPKVENQNYDLPSINIDAINANAQISYNGNDGHPHPFHVMFALSGNHPGVLAEFEVSLKSVLLNVPMERKTFVHVLTDVFAFRSMDEIFNRTQLPTWITRNQIEIHTYDVMPHIKELQRKIAETFQDMGLGPKPLIIYKATRLHTLGTFFRLIAHLVVPSSVEHLLYIDTDVVIMANLEGLYEQIQTKPDALFHWGEHMNAGFLVLNVNRMEEIWKIAKESPLKNISETYQQGVDDQLIFKAVNVTHPDKVNVLEPGWAMAATDVWNKKPREHGERFPNTGMLHFNGKLAYL